ncbi:hypothetical protein IKO70_02820 [bacterium]|nr:hypothetical protein [bacterium]
MSCVIKTLTPFINKDFLCKALTAAGCGYTVQGEKIITDRKDYRLGFQTFEKDFRIGKYVLNAYSHTDKNQAEFVSEIEKHYNIIYQEAIAEAERLRLEEEKKRLEEERKAFVEKQKCAIIEKAEAKGYSVKEENVKGKIKLVLVKRTY